VAPDEPCDWARLVCRMFFPFHNILKQYWSCPVNDVSQQGCHIGCPGAIGRVGGPIHYVWYKPYILDIFSKYSLKIPRIYSNISLLGGLKVYWA
jgi:hypothetical protein